MKSDLQDMTELFQGDEESVLTADCDAVASEPSINPNRRLRLPAAVQPH